VTCLVPSPSLPFSCQLIPSHSANTSSTPTPSVIFPIS